MTASRVVNNPLLVKEPTRSRVKRAMQDLGYLPNHLARSLIGNKLRVLALSVSDISNPFFTKLTLGVEKAASAAGYTVIVGNNSEDLSKEDAYLQAIGALRVEGLILSPTGDSGPVLELLRRQGIAFVIVDREVPGVASDLVRGESRNAAYLLTEHLISHGHRRIGMINGPAGASTARDRERGFRDALKAARIPLPGEYVRHAPFSRDGGRHEALAVLTRSDPPSALFTANNFLAFGCLEAARILGLRVPEDLAIVTFDDVELVAGDPFLTCAAQPAEDLGRTAAELLLSRLAGDRSAYREVVLDTEIHIRQSCGCRADPSKATITIPSRRRSRSNSPGKVGLMAARRSRRDSAG